MVIKVYWQTNEGRLVFLTILSSCIIRSEGIAPRYRKYMRTLRSKYFNPGIIEVEIFKCPDDLMHPHLNITEEDFVRWLGRVRIDNVVGMNDLAWLMRVKRKYEEGKDLVET